ncbi:GTPase Obg [Anatilimnocola aggregata]|uniref:GTPase Obg n=1 Tax=Anatilimnocola aggregata TaxID=2528021 RepID=A0A517Y9P9_9BACT|nr:GTPase ObgE [Anatilimnocola aggregata]QDU26960.1 GTPase Obg [Anatilimnocola aggregata]
MFVDRVQIEVQAGKGGNGCMSFRREKYVPNGGPDGGDGGKGGSVIIVARNGVNNLAGFSHQKFWKANSGNHGSGANKSGKDGHDLTLEVPVGTLIVDCKNDFVLRDMMNEGDTIVVARGGEAGKGNTRFKTSTNRAPRDHTPGGEGEKRELILELKVIADVGIIGKPNAGKSTLLSRLTKARPQIADYPFTTKYPNLGMVQVDRDRHFVLADIPGLIEGASHGAGLGHEFLRHVERAGILVHLVEPEPADQTDPLTNYHAIREELSLYDKDLGLRQEIVAVTKAELPSAAEVRQQLQESIGSPVLLISAVTGEGLNHLMQAVTTALDAKVVA